MRSTRTRALSTCALTLILGGCTAWLVDKAVDIVLDQNYSAKFTVKGDAAKAQDLESTLRDQFGLSTVIDIVEAGVWTIKVVGVASKIVDATKHLMKLGFSVLANDAVAEGILHIALAALK